ncbi:MAG: T9SS type A sorting domain-containing protein [Bacteroidales bacterium]
MKTVALIPFLVLSFFMPLQVNAQATIYAGQITGEHIHYIDFDPDSLLTLNKWNEIEHLFLDVDLDGTPEFRFNIRYVYYNYYEDVKAFVEVYNDDVELVKTNGTHYWARKLDELEPIGENLAWTGDTIKSLLLRSQHYEVYPPPGYYNTYGVFSGEGYLGFKITKPWETYYGWVFLFAEAMLIGGSVDLSIKAMSAAFYSETVGVEQVSAKSANLKIYPNPCTEKLTILNQFSESYSWYYKVSDVFGTLWKSENCSLETTNIDTRNLQPGLYFIDVFDNKQRIHRAKVVKLQ